MEKEALEVVLDRERLVLEEREGEAATDCGGPTTPCIEVDRVGVALGEAEVVTIVVIGGVTAAVFVSDESTADEVSKRDVEARAVLAELDALDELVTTGATAGRRACQRPSRLLESESKPVNRNVRKMSFCAPLVPKDHEA